MISAIYRVSNRLIGYSMTAVALLLSATAGSGVARASLILCPNQALQGGFGNTFTPVAGSEDGTCGNNSGETLALANDTNYAKLMWNTSTDPNGPSTEAIPSDITLSDLPVVNANVTFNADQADVSPFFMVSFSDPTDSLGQNNASDQILLIEFQNLGISGVGATTMTLDPNATQFNLYDNTTGHYLLGGQADTNTVNSWLATYAALGSDSVNGIWLGEGLAGGPCVGDCTETLTVDSAQIASTAPEPSTLALLLLGTGALWTRVRAPRR